MRSFLTSVAVAAATVFTGRVTESAVRTENDLIESLQREVDWLREELERVRGQQAVQSSFEDGTTGQECGRTLFLVLCVGTAYFDLYCGPLFASFERAYGEGVKRQRLVAFSANVNTSVLEAARARFAPWGYFEHFDLGGGHYPLHNRGASETHGIECEASEGHEQSCRFEQDILGHLTPGTNVLIKFRQVAAYVEEHGRGFDCTVVMDSDLLFLRPLGQSLTGLVPEGSWDVAFTTYDESFRAPWAPSAADVGRTPGGLVRVNTGVTVIRLRDLELVVRFLYNWARASELLLTRGHGGPGGLERKLWSRWQEELSGELGGNDPAALALLLSSLQPETLSSLLGWGSCAVCAWAVKADARLPGEGAPLPLRFRALPARVLNHPESMVGGSFPPDLAVVHLKGPWWRAAVSDGVLLKHRTRKAEWNRDALVLYGLAFDEWQFALPPDVRAPASLALRELHCTDVAPLATNTKGVNLSWPRAAGAAWEL